MALKDHVIADSDLHVMEPADLWQRYMPPEYAHAAPIGLTELVRDMRVRVKNHTLLRIGHVRPQKVDGRKTGWRKEHADVYADPEANGWDPASTERAMAMRCSTLLRKYLSNTAWSPVLCSTSPSGCLTRWITPSFSPYAITPAASSSAGRTCCSYTRSRSSSAFAIATGGC